MRFTRWDQELNSDATTALLSELALRHLGGVIHAAGREIERAIHARDFLALCSYEPDYADLPLDCAQGIRQALALFSKRSDLKIPGIDPEKAAFVKFEEAEALCRSTNVLFKAIASGNACVHPDVDSVLYGAQRKIARILGPVPKLSDLKPVFGPGATTQVKKRDASPRSKLGQTFACSKELEPIVKYCLDELQGWLPESEADTSSVDVEIHPAVLSFVQKNAKTHRTIAVEPMLNSMFQLGIGKLISDRLKRFGVDIHDQTRNQTLAKRGSLSGDLATLDLSSASDTVALELVYHLLPLDWAHFLSRFRTGTVRLKDKSELELAKFSSMGNGFTFPLETLIFFAITWAAVEATSGGAGSDEFLQDVAVYGDDIVAPSYSVELLKRSLFVCGFQLNTSKSFVAGPFRESCGKDYFSGTDIRPFYQKGPLTGETVFTLHNFYVRHGLPDYSTYVLNWIDRSLRLFGPDGYGDGHLLGVHVPYRPEKLTDRQWSGYLFDTYTHKTKKSFKVYRGDRVLPSYSIYASPPGEVWEMRASVYLGIKRGRYVESTVRTVGMTSYQKGALGVTIPGASGYKRITVYTLG